MFRSGEDILEVTFFPIAEFGADRCDQSERAQAIGRTDGHLHRDPAAERRTEQYETVKVQCA